MKDQIAKAAGAPVRGALGYTEGLKYPFRGARFVFRTHPGLARIYGVPIVLVLLALVALVHSVYTHHEAATAWLWPEPLGEDWWATSLRVLHGFAELLVGTLMLLVGYVLVTILGALVAAPFNDALSERVEALYTGRPGPAFSFRTLLRDLLRTIRLEALKILLYVGVMLPLFLFGFILPVLGPVQTAAGFLFTTGYFALDYMDWPASREGLGVRARLAFVRDHLGPALGFGTGVWLFLFVPVVNLLLMPAAVAGGTMMYLDLRAKLQN